MAILQNSYSIHIGYGMIVWQPNTKKHLTMTETYYSISIIRVMVLHANRIWLMVEETKSTAIVLAIYESSTIGCGSSWCSILRCNVPSHSPRNIEYLLDFIRDFGRFLAAEKADICCIYTIRTAILSADRSITKHVHGLFWASLWSRARAVNVHNVTMSLSIQYITFVIYFAIHNETHI